MVALGFLAVIAAALMTWAGWPGSSGAETAAERRIALVIGNAGYRNLPPLRDPAYDATNVAVVLLELGFEVDLSLDADADQLLSRIEAFSANLNEADIGLVYYAGHAVQLEGRNYLLPIGADVNDPADLVATAVELETVVRVFDRPDLAGVLLVDANVTGLPRIFDWPDRAPPPRGLAQIAAPSNVAVLMAAQPDMVTFDGAGDGDGAGSVFANALLRNLSTPGIGLDMLLELVRSDVIAATNGAQEPWSNLFAAQAPGDGAIVLNQAPDAPQPPSPTSGAIDLYLQAQMSVDPEQRRWILEELIALFPDHPLAALAREEVVGLLAEAGDGGDTGRVPPMPETAPAVPEPAVSDPVAEPVPEVYEEPGVDADATETGQPGAVSQSPPVVVSADDVPNEPADEPMAADEDIIVLGFVDMTEPLPDVQAEPMPPPPPVTEQVSRYPALQTPDTAAPGDLVPVMVWLSTAPFAEPLEISAGAASVGDDGLLTFDLPVDDPNNPVWDISVVVHAPGFAFEGGDPAATVQLTTVGDSTRALFMLRATDALAEQSTARISATLWHDGSFLAEVARVIAVPAENGPTDGGGQQIAVVDANQIAPTALTLQPDLTVRIDYDDPAALGSGQVIIASPYLEGLLIGEFEVPPSTTDWLREQYRGFVDARHRDLQARGATHPTENGSADAGEVQLARLRLDGFGQRLYQEFAPELFKEALWELIDNPDVDLSTIQVYSNNPILPWELMRPVPPGGGDARNYMGAEFQIARWHVGGDEIVRPRPSQELHLDTIAAVAPSYDATDRLSYQTVELAAIGAMPGYRNVPGTLNAVFSLLTGAPAGIIHFAGHGVVRGDGQTVPYFAIALEDAELDLMSWRGMIGSAVLDDVLVFFNACDVAQTQYVANFVDGWAPAVLDAGALGFIGGLWPVFDESAARFAADFYAAMPAAGGGDVHPAAVLRDLRAQFAETGDPTFLSYVFFGDVNLTVSAAQN